MFDGDVGLSAAERHGMGDRPGTGDVHGGADVPSDRPAISSRCDVSPATVVNVPMVAHVESFAESSTITIAPENPENAVTCRCATAPFVDCAVPSTDAPFVSTVTAARS